MKSKLIITGMSMVIGILNFAPVNAMDEDELAQSNMELTRLLENSIEINNSLNKKNDINEYLAEAIENVRANKEEEERLKSQQIVMTAYPHSDFKAYMQWTATSTNSPQYKLAETAKPDPETSIMMIGDRYLVALGYAYVDYIGEEIDIHMESGQVIKGIVGDFKAIKDTDQWNSTAVEKGDILEFVVLSNEAAGDAVNGAGDYNKFFPGQVKEFRK